MELYIVKVIMCLMIASSMTATAAGSDEESIRVTSIVEKPFLSPKNDSAGQLKGNARYEGYIVDLLQRLGNKANFNYDIELVADNMYGSKVNGRWNGMIREIIDGDAKLAAAPITISDERSTVVDFTVPFMTFDLAILMKKHPAAENSRSTITSIRDLADQDVIKYGVIEGGRTAAFFRESSDPLYSLMWTKMSSNRDYGTVPDTAQGVERVRQSKGKFAFIIEGTSATYWINREPCDLVKVDVKMDAREYALAVPRGSALKAKLDDALKQMEDDEELNKLYNKWWFDKSQCSGASSFVYAGSLALIAALFAITFPVV